MTDNNEINPRVPRFSATEGTMTFKYQLRLYLQKRDITASQLAKLAGVPKQSLSDWMSGSNPRDVRMVKSVADVFGVTVDHLMFGSGIEPVLGKILDGNNADEVWATGVYEIKFRKIK